MLPDSTAKWPWKTQWINRGHPLLTFAKLKVIMYLFFVSKDHISLKWICFFFCLSKMNHHLHGGRGRQQERVIPIKKLTV